MAANTSPIYSLTPRFDTAQNNTGSVVGPSANTAQDGSGANMYQVTQAGANGSYLQKVIFRSIGSPAATVARLYINDNTAGSFVGGTTNAAANTFLIAELSLPSQTLSQTVQSATLELSLNFAINPSYRLLVSFGTSTGSAGTGYSVAVIGGDY